MVLQNGRVDLGLILSLLGSLASLGFNKRYHVWLGIAFTLLSAVHTWQHRRRLSHYLHKEREHMKLSSLYTNLISSSSQTAAFLKQVQVMHYMPGRVRLFSRHLLHNAEIGAKVSQYLTSIQELDRFEINLATGSLLLEYSPANVASSVLLQDLEQLVAKQYRR